RERHRALHPPRCGPRPAGGGRGYARRGPGPPRGSAREAAAPAGTRARGARRAGYPRPPPLRRPRGKDPRLIETLNIQALADRRCRAADLRWRIWREWCFARSVLWRLRYRLLAIAALLAVGGLLFRTLSPVPPGGRPLTFI